MMFGLVNDILSLPEWQALKVTFFAPFACVADALNLLTDHIYEYVSQLQRRLCTLGRHHGPSVWLLPFPRKVHVTFTIARTIAQLA